ncbi:MAG: RluA family pseudouridine synthase [Clostridiales bacterium]|nr:RluA family pseudouridine synthase [Clostridiales bacterium]
MNTEQFVCGIEEEGMRLDSFLSLKLQDVTRSRVQKLIDEYVFVNGKKAGKSLKLKRGDEVSVTLPEAVEAEINAENIPLEILYEDSDLIVVNKSQGMVVHPAPGHFSGTLVNALMYHCKGELSGINGVMRPGIVHRIDRDTSGVLVAAKNDFAHNALAEQLEKHSMKRIYKGIVYNGFKEPEGTIETQIGRSQRDRKKMAVLKAGGRRAVTHYKVIDANCGFSFVEFRLETGRTHQIRVHMSHIGHPLLGDPVYGPQKCPYNLKGQALHAEVLGFIHPSTNKYIEFSADLPEYFREVLKRLGMKEWILSEKTL